MNLTRSGNHFMHQQEMIKQIITTANHMKIDNLLNHRSDHIIELILICIRAIQIK